MKAQDDGHIDELIGRAMEDDVPADVERRLRSQLADFRTRLGSTDQPTMPRSARPRRRVWRGVAATAAAATVLAAVAAWLLRPQVSLADVAAAVLQRPWIHATETDEDGETFEAYYSPTKNVSAWCYKDWIEYHDHRLKVYDSYDVEEKVLYRVPQWTLSAERYAWLATMLRVLLASGKPAEKPLEVLEFLGDDRAQMEVVDQRLERVEEDGRRWLDYHLTVRGGHFADPIEMHFRVDADTKLPRQCRFEGRPEGKPMVKQMRFDYPDKGPADVYDLGVPKTAKLVDRMPSDDLARILDTMRAGRQRMDDYRALVVQYNEAPGFAWWMEQPMVVYRKGDKFRADLPWWSDRPFPHEEPAEDEDREAWWWKRAEDFIFVPTCVTIPWKEFYVEHSTKWRTVKDPDGSPHLEIESVQKCNIKVPPGDVIAPYSSRRPEFVCRTIGAPPCQQWEHVLEMNPTEGPPGTILLHVRRTGRARLEPVIPEGLPPQPDAYRSWLDPTRDYTVVRFDMLSGGEPGSEEITHSQVVEEMAQSPQGTWYATRFRLKNAARDSSGKTYDIVIHFYVDFDADLPDSLFEPPKPGRIH